MVFKLVTALPINRGIFKEELSYFTSKDVEIGDLISISVRNRKVSALVVFVESVRPSQSGIKRMPMTLKKVVEVKKRNFLNQSFILAARETAPYFVSTPGQIINHFIPKIILDRND